MEGSQDRPLQVISVKKKFDIAWIIFMFFLGI